MRVARHGHLGDPGARVPAGPLEPSPDVARAARGRAADAAPRAPAVRRAGIAVLLLILAGGAVVVALPLDVAAVRLGGVSVAWWYAALVAPSASAVTAALALLASRATPPS